MTKMFFISGENHSQGDSLDQFVEASTPEEALKLWEGGKLVRDFGPADDDVRVWEVPKITGKPKTHGWLGPSGVKCRILVKPT